MYETAQEYTQRILSYLGGKSALSIQKSTPQKLALLINRVDKKRLTKRPAPGKWSVSEVLAHLATRS
jgi:Holliday junction resolvasome RuvABC DNA-binding subunit